MRVGVNSGVFFKAPVIFFFAFGENYIRPRHFQRGAERRPGESAGKGILIETISKPIVAQRAGAVLFHYSSGFSYNIGRG